MAGDLVRSVGRLNAQARDEYERVRCWLEGQGVEVPDAARDYAEDVVTASALVPLLPGLPEEAGLTLAVPMHPTKREAD